MVDGPFVPARGIADWRHPPFLTRHAGRGRGFVSTRPAKSDSSPAPYPYAGHEYWKLAGLDGHDAPSLKPPVPVDLDTPFVATRDGFVLAGGQCTDESAGWMEGVQTLGGRLHVVAIASYQYSPLENVLVKSGSFCMPVRKGTPFQLRSTAAFGNPKAWAYFCELSEPMAFPGDMEALWPHTLYKARKDGILVATISATANDEEAQDPGSSGRIEVFSWPDSEMPSADALTGTAAIEFHPSGRWLTGNTVMMPVPAGNAFKVEIKDSTGSHQVQVWWMALSARA